MNTVMLSYPLYSVNCLNYITNDVETDGIIYQTYTKAVENVNQTLKKYVFNNFKISVSEENLLNQIDEKTKVTSTFTEKIDDNNYLIITKYNNKTLDVYVKTINKGYVYNTESLLKKLKIFIKEYYEIDNPFNKIATETEIKSQISNVFEPKNNNYATENFFLQELKQKIKQLNLKKQD